MAASQGQRLVKPSGTRCFVDGSEEIGNDFKLKCEPKEGSLPLQFEWQKLSDSQTMPTPWLAEMTSPVISVKNASSEYSGTYSCTVQNRVGSDQCMLRLDVVPPSNRAGTIAGAVIGTLLALVLIGAILFCCHRKRREEKYEKEVHHDIREDVPPPKSRTSTARSYIGSNHSSLGSMSPSNMEGYSKTQYNQVPSEDFERAPQSPTLAPAKLSPPRAKATTTNVLYSSRLTSSRSTPPHPIRNLTRSRQELKSVTDRLTDPDHEQYACFFTAHAQARQ